MTHRLNSTPPAFPHGAKFPLWGSVPASFSSVKRGWCGPDEPFTSARSPAFIVLPSPVRGCECVGEKPPSLGTGSEVCLEGPLPERQPQNSGSDQPAKSTPVPPHPQCSAEPAWELHSPGWPRLDPNQRMQTRREGSRKAGICPSHQRGPKWAGGACRILANQNELSGAVLTL